MLLSPVRSYVKTLFQSTLIFLIVVLMSCNNNDYFPKPHGYLRIDLPENEYHLFDSTFPFGFRYSKYAKITFDEGTKQNPYWMNIDYAAYNGRIHISYKSLHNHQLYNLQEDTREMVFKHAPKAVGIKESYINMPESKVYGIVYTIEGRDAASPFQFYLTDSTDHFVRGALYFNVVPNNDSLKPVIDYIIHDIDFLVSTFSWKSVAH